MRIGEKGSFHLEALALFIHFKDKIFIEIFLAPWLKRNTFANLVILDKFAAKDREGNAGIIATGKHEPIEQLFHSINLSNLELSWGSFDFGLKRANGDLADSNVDIVFLAEFDGENAGHDFGEGGDFQVDLGVQGSMYIFDWTVVFLEVLKDNIGLRRYVLGIAELIWIVFEQWLLQSQGGFLLPLLCHIEFLGRYCRVFALFVEYPAISDWSCPLS